ncbi:DNA polymerase Y family protein [Streptomyces sp. NPDC054958]
MVAAATPPGRTTVIDAKDVERWLRPRPVAALYGVGPATAGKLHTYGLHTIGDVAETPMPTLVRLFGAAAGRALHAHAHGQDPRTVQTQPLAKSLGADRAFEHDVLDPAEHRRTLLDLAEEVAARLRDGQQAAGGLAVSVRAADRSTHRSHRPHQADRHHRLRALRPARPPARPRPHHQPARPRPPTGERSHPATHPRPRRRPRPGHRSRHRPSPRPLLTRHHPTRHPRQKRQGEYPITHPKRESLMRTYPTRPSQ